MSDQLESRRPVLKAGCRLSPDGQVLLIPEGALRMQGPGARILELCDGVRTFSEIVDQLSNEFPAAEHAKILAETTAFLSKLAERGAVEFA